jgi:predicted phosphate transport protein (TIGR00153 family)
MSLIGNLFGHSPIRPMQQHMRASLACARAVGPFIEAMVAGDLESMRQQRTEIVKLEHEADEIKHEIRRHLPKRLLMAIERRDMLEILDAQDSIADVAQDIADLAVLRGMVPPESLRQPLRDLVARVIVACEQCDSIVSELDELVETGFGPHESSRVEVMITRLGHLESETDQLAEAAQRALFALEDELGVGAYFWYQLINWVADMADHAERVGNRLRLLIAI